MQADRIRMLSWLARMDEGNTTRADEVAVVALIESLLTLSVGDREFVTLTNWNGRTVGRLAAVSAFAPRRAGSR
jgi:hypothetical protein